MRAVRAQRQTGAGAEESAQPERQLGRAAHALQAEVHVRVGRADQAAAGGEWGEQGGECAAGAARGEAAAAGGGE